MKLVDFLKTANADNELALPEARAFPYTPSVKMARDIRRYLTLNGKWSKVLELADTRSSPLCDAANGLVYKANENERISLNAGSQIGLAHLAMLDAFETANILDAQQKQAILDLDTHQPFADVTLYDVILARNTIPNRIPLDRKPSGCVVINVTAECEKHNPRVTGLDPDTGNREIVSHFSQVGAVGKYKCRIIGNHTELQVDAAYTGMEAG